MHARRDAARGNAASAAWRGTGGEQPRDARLPLCGMLRIARMQLVQAAAGVCIHEQQALVLARERRQHFEQQHVLVDVGEVAGVILVAVFHETFSGAAAFIHCRTEVRGHVASRRLMMSRCVRRGLSACASDGKSGERAIAPPTRIPDPVEAVGDASGQQVSTTAIPREVRRAVVADAAKRFNVAESAVVLTRAEQVTWPDGSLGCPQPGRMYTQMLVAGFRVAAKTTEGELTYHTDGRGNVVNCASGMAGQRPVDAVRKPVEPRTGPPPQTPDR